MEQSSTDGVSGQLSTIWGWSGGGLFSVEMAICPSVSSERRVPTRRNPDGRSDTSTG